MLQNTVMSDAKVHLFQLSDHVQWKRRLLSYVNRPHLYSFLVEGHLCLLDQVHDRFKLGVKKRRGTYKVTARLILNRICSISKEEEKLNASCTFFLCSFCRSLNCSILFTSSFSCPASTIWRFPMFSISEKCQIPFLKSQQETYWMKQETEGTLTCFHFIKRWSHRAAKTTDRPVD